MNREIDEYISSFYIEQRILQVGYVVSSFVLEFGSSITVMLIVNTLSIYISMNSISMQPVYATQTRNQGLVNSISLYSQSPIDFTSVTFLKFVLSSPSSLTWPKLRVFIVYYLNYSDSFQPLCPFTCCMLSGFSCV